jgi:hypothetical protein
MDKMLMPVYRMPENHLFGYFIGTFWLSFICIIIGEHFISLAFHLHKKNIIHDNEEINRFQTLSVKALIAGDMSAYKTCNSIANEAFGRNFFRQIVLSASYLWPLFFALGWMQWRFAGVEFNIVVFIPGIGDTVGYGTTFVLCYVISRLLYKNIKNVLYSLKNRKNDCRLSIP